MARADARERTAASLDAEAEALVRDALAGARERVRAQLEDELTAELAARARALLDRPDAGAPAVEPPGEAPVAAPDPPAAPAPVVREEPGAPASTGLWAYCVTAAPGPTVAGDAEGVAGGAVEVVVVGELAALVSPVPLDEFGERELPERLEDLDWLAATARAHEAVLDAVRAQTAVVPLRLCTIHRDVAGLEAALTAERDTFARALERLAGRAEWGVKLFADPQRLRAMESDAAHGDDPGAAGQLSGHGYLDRRRRERGAASRVRRQVAAWAREAHERLVAVASDARANQPQQGELTGREEPMLLNGVYLVDDDAIETFRAVVDDVDADCRARGWQLELTGPWPPYHFVEEAA